MESDKLNHKKYLADIRCDVSQHKKWRAILFSNEQNTPFLIDAESVGDIFLGLAKNIKKYNLKYVVENIGYTKTNSEPEIIFKFYAEDYPEYVKYSYNNPKVI
jgi:hypothetical protein